MTISTMEYILIAVGIFTLPLIIGFIILGVVAWRIGTRMERQGLEDAYASSTSEPLSENMESQNGIENTFPEEDRNTFKLEDYSEITLENGK